MSNTDAIVNKMKKLGVAHTRENYLDLAYMGAPPAKLTAEEEEHLPEEFQSNEEKEGEDDGK